MVELFPQKRRVLIISDVNRFKSTRIRINKFLGTTLEPDFNTIIVNSIKSHPIWVKTGRSIYSPYALKITETVYHTDPEELDFKTSTTLNVLRPNKLKVKRRSRSSRVISLEFIQKTRAFEYRKIREERVFYTTFMNTVRVSTKFPFMKHKFSPLVPPNVVPVDPDPRIIRKRYSQPVFMNLDNIINFPHNGLRLRKRRKL